MADSGWQDADLWLFPLGAGGGDGRMIEEVRFHKVGGPWSIVDGRLPMDRHGTHVGEFWDWTARADGWIIAHARLDPGCHDLTPSADCRLLRPSRLTNEHQMVMAVEVRSVMMIPGDTCFPGSRIVWTERS